MFFFSAMNGFFIQILLRVLSSSIMCQFVLSILPVCMVVLSYGITNGRFFSSVSAFVLLGNSKSFCEKFLILSNCFLTSERLYPLLIRLFLSIVSFSSSSLLSVIILLYLNAWLYMIPFLQLSG